MATSRSRSSASRLVAAPGMPASARALRGAPEANRALHSVSSGAMSGRTSQALRMRSLRRLPVSGRPAGGEHGGRGAQRGEVGGGVPLVGDVEYGGLVQPGVGLGEQIEGGGRRRGAARHGVDVGCRAGQ